MNDDRRTVGSDQILDAEYTDRRYRKHLTYRCVNFRSVTRDSVQYISLWLLHGRSTCTTKPVQSPMTTLQVASHGRERYCNGTDAKCRAARDQSSTSHFTVSDASTRSLQRITENTAVRGINKMPRHFNDDFVYRTSQCVAFSHYRTELMSVSKTIILVETHKWIEFKSESAIRTQGPHLYYL